MGISGFVRTLVALCVLGSSAYAAPAQILLIRHGENEKSSDHLSSQGWERAKALPAMFHGRVEFQRFGLPAALFAMAPDTDQVAHSFGTSVRAIETLKYVSEDLKLPIRADYARDDFQSMVDAVVADRSLDGKFVVICWEHKVLTDIAKAIGVKHAPKYPKGKFDRAWLVTLNSSGAPTLEDYPERLLPGDDEE
jgi:hypothetical protein